MKPELFGMTKNGELVPITVGDRLSWAFIPNPLPPHWRVPDSLWPHVVRARALIAELDTLASTLPNPMMFLGALTRREAIKSSTIEGTTIAPEDLLRHEHLSSVPRPSTDKALDVREVMNCQDALREGRHRFRDEPIGLRHLCDLHKILLEGTRSKDKCPGQIRQKQVFVKPYTPPPADTVQNLLQNLEGYIQNSQDVTEPLIRTFIAHYQFEAIHPFEDGNGRIGRILLSLMLFKELGLREPWLHLSGYFEQHRRDYIARLLGISTHGDWDEWIEFCVEGTIQEATSAIEKCNRLQTLRRVYLERFESRSPRAHAILDHLFFFPIIEATDLAALLQVSYNTARADIDHLVEARILSPRPDTYPKEYVAHEIMEIGFPQGD